MHVNETSRGDHLAMHTNTNHYAAPRTNMMVYIDYISVKLEENLNLCMYVHSSITHNQKRANHLNAQQLVNGKRSLALSGALTAIPRTQGPVARRQVRIHDRHRASPYTAKQIRGRRGLGRGCN